MKNNVLELRNISKYFPGVKALSDVTFSVKKGEVHGLIGENGAGKSTLMKVLTGIYQANEGDIYLDGQKVNVHNPKEAQELGISIIHQELNLLNGLSVAENIYVGRQPKSNGMIDWAKMYGDAAELFKRIDIDMDPHQTVRQLSLAQQQMVEIAKAVSFDSKVVVMDEPTSSLTIQETEILFKIIDNLKENGVAVVFISHRLEEIFEICSRVTVLRDGEYIGSKDIRDVNRDQLIAMMIGRELTQQYPERHAEIGEISLEVKNLNAGSRVKDVSFACRKGEVLGITGLVGAGRTETMRAIFGADKKDSGEIYLNGELVDIKSPRDAVKNKIAFATEDRKSEGLFLSFEVAFNIVYVALDRIRKNSLINKSLEEEAAKKYVKDLRVVTPSIKQRAVFLSGGNQQKVVIAKWLFSDAEIVIMDEPTRGIDVGAKREIYEIINELAEEGKTIIIVSSDMEEVLGTSDRILVMREGEIRGEVVKKDFSPERISQLSIGGGI